MSFLYVNLEGMNQEQDLAIATQRPSEGGGERIPKPFDQLPRLAAETTADNPWPVSVLSQKFHTAVERWPAAWIAGQITEINTRRAGSAYLTVRDDVEDIAISVSGWRAFASKAASFKQGDRVVVHGKADIWVKQTRLSFIGDDIRKIGSGGGLKEQIDQLRMKLKGEGLFDADRKLPLPEFPSCIGLICAPHARAEGDVITNVRLRWPTVRFNIVHAFVQGPQCPQSIVEAIHRLDADPDVDVIIVARGGGSFEDLIGFSDEAVVRATAGCETPIVSAIGHEDDWTLIDLAADLRASTPTDAAKKVVPDVHEQWQLIGNAIDRMRMRIDARVGNEIRLEPAQPDAAADHAGAVPTVRRRRAPPHGHRPDAHRGRRQPDRGEAACQPDRAQPAIHARPRIRRRPERRRARHRRRRKGERGRPSHADAAQGGHHRHRPVAECRTAAECGADISRITIYI